MNEFLTALKTIDNYTTTENGAVALHSTMNACLDAFGSLAAMKLSDEETIINTFSKAFAEDKAFAMRLLFYVRDIRGGQGMRRIFRVILKWLAEKEPAYVINNLDNILYFGRGDDFLCLLGTSVRASVLDYISYVLHEDLNNRVSNKPISLLAKWLPSENASSEQTKAYARQIRISLHWSSRTYRKTLSKLRAYLKVVERDMSANNWTGINYETVPAKAAMNYGDAFYRHDETGYVEYIEKLANGQAKVNAASLFPVDIVHKILDNYYTLNLKDRKLYNAMWKALPNYCSDEETGICVVDTSGSMYGTPIEVAVSLGMYCADKCYGPFKNHFITFSHSPRLQEIVGDDIVDKIHNLERADWDSNTDLEAVFDLILRTAVSRKLPQQCLPKKLYIISDMQFDEARGADGYYGWYGQPQHPTRPFMDIMADKFARAGYEMPMIVYWNVRASECGMFQSTFEGKDCCMVSGYSPSLFKAIAEGTTYEEVVTESGEVERKAHLDPIDVMNAAIMNERYDRVWVG